MPFPIAALDIETGPVNWNKPQRAKVILIGLLIAKSPKGLSYKAYRNNSKDLRELVKRLKHFSGRIISYNGLSFDYLLLRKLLDTRSFFHKSFDLFYWVKSKVGHRKGTRLEDLAQENLRLTKQGSWKEGYESWKHGNSKKLIAYNKRDCELTLRLYLKLLGKGFLLIKQQRMQLSRVDVQIPQVSYESWRSDPRFNRRENIYRDWNDADSDEGYWEAMLEAMGHDRGEIKKYGTRLLSQYSGTVYTRCKCGKHLSYSWIEWPGFRDVRDVKCPSCKTVVGRADLDWGPAEITVEEYRLKGQGSCPVHNAPLKFKRHVAYKPGSEEWDALWCPKCRREYQVGRV